MKENSHASALRPRSIERFESDQNPENRTAFVVHQDPSGRQTVRTTSCFDCWPLSHQESWGDIGPHSPYCRPAAWDREPETEINQWHEYPANRECAKSPSQDFRYFEVVQHCPHQHACHERP